jgi:catechol 2,3-dioxygenase-like lactoylglutathione lyase family enzyme
MMILLNGSKRYQEMMFDHVEYSVQSYAQSLKFYASCLPKLGSNLLFSSDKNKNFGFGGRDSTELLISEGLPTSPKLHIAFRASSEKQVNEFYEQAISNGGKCNGPPGYRKDYDPGYYAAFVIDPDGHNVEALYRA